MLCKKVLDNGGSLHPLTLDFSKTNGTGIFNPSVYYDNEQNKLYVNIRHCQVTLYHTEASYFESFWGPLHYCHPENDMTLTTTNYFGELDPETIEYKFISKVDTSLLDVRPIWSFVGLEDCRIVKWDNKLYVCGVRRDTTTNGEGRMELSQLTIDGDHVREITRNRLQPPNHSYCEKNWMPIVDKDWHYIKWCNPTELISVDLSTNRAKTEFTGTHFWYPRDFRGGSQVIRLNDKYRFACVHTVHLFNSEQGRKNAVYRHCFIVWDNNWNLIKHTDEFSFLDAKIEFCAGMTKYKNDFLLSFGFQDNSAYVLKVPQDLMEKICLS